MPVNHFAKFAVSVVLVLLAPGLNTELWESFCPPDCSSGSCCESSPGVFGCCPYQNGVCCADGQHCCAESSKCDLTGDRCIFDTMQNKYDLEYKPALLNSTLAPITAPFVVQEWLRNRLLHHVICPDRISACPDSNTCCRLADESWGCCPHPQAVCCSDGRHCCPSGYTCDAERGGCVSSVSNTESSKIGVHSPALELFNIPPRSVVCPGHESFCPEKSTCCHQTDQSWGCCPMEEAVCCADNSHCCPRGTVCDAKEARCVRIGVTPELVDFVSNRFTGKSKLMPARRKVTIKTGTENNIFFEGFTCSDGNSECPQGSTCCRSTDNSWACCPMPGAVCCGDGLHCCPTTTTCDPTSGICVANPITFPATRMLPGNQKLKSSSSEQLCPDQKTRCQDMATCCKLNSGVWGCCPMPQAVCCVDGIHCCPHKWTCDVEHERCLHTPGTNTSVPWSTKVAAKPVVPQSNICPDGRSVCSNDATCCAVQNGTFACCPTPRASCCGDGLHCCPEGWQCDLSQSRCTRSDSVAVMPSIPWSRKQPASPLYLKPDEQFCPDMKSVCSSRSTCCKLPSLKEWGCCPLPDAVCCSDQEHCCPTGMICDVAKQRCLKSIDSALTSEPWQLKQSNRKSISKNVCPDGKSACADNETCCMSHEGWSCCPFPQAICCADQVHCCPDETVCDPAEGRCLDNRQSVSGLSFKSRPVSTTAADDIVCPDASFHCPSGSTCCRLSGGDWACCPSPDAVCCDDGEHCCPHGMKCDIEHNRCTGINSSNMSSPNAVMWQKKFVATRLDVVICPGYQQACPAGFTCCGQLNGVQWSCCPHDSASCCSDQKHCCPKGYQCDLNHRTCIAQNTGPYFGNIRWSTQVPASPYQSSNYVTCPGGTARCPDDSTCCMMKDQTWGCCPMSEAICCADQIHCCPNGMRCDDKAGICTRGLITQLEKMQVEKKPIATKLFPTVEVLCPNRQSSCPENATCCELADGTWACCAFPNAVCCADKIHCCPNGLVCHPQTGQCLHHLVGEQPNSASRSHSKAVQLATAAPDSARMSQPFKMLWRFFANHTAVWCGACPNDWGCCLAGHQFGNAKWACCPFVGGTCCADGSTCCPANSNCLPNGECESSPKATIEFSSRYLLPAKHDAAGSLDFLSSMGTGEASRQGRLAKSDIMLRVTHYRTLKQRRRVICPDILHYCQVGEQCCPTGRRNMYVCAPKQAICCKPEAESYCPLWASCSDDGARCVRL